MQPHLTPLPATLAAKLTSSSPQAADSMAAEQAEAMEALQLVPPLTPPTLPAAILCDHRHTLALFAVFFGAASAAEAADEPAAAAAAGPSAGTPQHLAAIKLAAGAIAVDLHLHARAEEEVLHPLLAAHCGGEGARLAANCSREHAEMDAELAAALADCGALDHPAPEGGAAERRRALVKRMQALEQAFIAHQVEEESEVLPRLASALPAAEQCRLAAAFFRAKRDVGPLVPAASPAPPTACGARP